MLIRLPHVELPHAIQLAHAVRTRRLESGRRVEPESMASRLERTCLRNLTKVAPSLAPALERVPWHLVLVDAIGVITGATGTAPPTAPPAAWLLMVAPM